MFCVVLPGISVLTDYCTCSLEVESHHMAANSPQWVRVIVGGLHALTFWIDPAKCFAVIL